MLTNLERTWPVPRSDSEKQNLETVVPALAEVRRGLLDRMTPGDRAIFALADHVGCSGVDGLELAGLVALQDTLPNEILRDCFDRLAPQCAPEHARVPDILGAAGIRFWIIAACAAARARPRSSDLEPG